MNYNSLPREVRHLELTRADSISTISSNATASNLPGAGRVVGNVFETLGRRLESIINRVATDRGLGPLAVAQDIRKLRRHDETTFVQRYTAPSRQLSKQEAKALKKRCEKLLKYAKAKQLDTQLVALEEVTALTIEDPIVKAILKDCRVDSLRPNYREVVLESASDRALSTIRETQTHSLWSDLIVKLESGNRNGIDWGVLRNSFVDSKVSFIAGRYLTHLLGSKSTEGCLADFWLLYRHYLETASTMPHAIEWSNVNTCSTMSDTFVLNSVIEGSPHEQFETLALSAFREIRHLPDFFHRYFESPKIEFIVDSNTQELIVDYSEVIDPHMERRSTLCVNVLIALTGSREFRDHQSFIQNLYFTSRSMLKDTILGSDVLIAYCHMAHFSGLRDLKVTKSFPQISQLEGPAALLERNMDGTSLPEGRALAKFLAVKYMTLSRYHKTELSLQSDHFSDFVMASGEYEKGVKELFEVVGRQYADAFLLRVTVDGVCCYIEDYFSILDGSHISKAFKAFPNRKICIDILPYNVESDLMFLEVSNGLNEPFSVNGHYPILAGYDRSGKPTYVGRLYGSFPHLCSPYLLVADKASTGTTYYANDQKRTLRTDCFDVLVLRQNPSDILPGYVRTFEGSADPTGPLGWRKLWPMKDPVVSDILDENARSLLGLWDDFLSGVDIPAAQIDPVFELEDDMPPEGTSRGTENERTTSGSRLRYRRYMRCTRCTRKARPSVMNTWTKLENVKKAKKSLLKEKLRAAERDYARARV
ncbi:hypothetical protein SCHPADRAFT_1000667 [Schizopora paradoxa]|uniref:Uncharacterized protein n=1 Tax=Schizopora paradoxa TaxID=27342 RepID=A0A0H2RBL9_9AGAM|nr:hypothetical protein SCHPADRAFT_1000667 [Schizopora paradoxa]